jgi:hypothetical protein
VLRAGLDALEGGHGPGRLLYVLDGEARHRRRWPAGGECGRVPLDEGNGGGMGGTSRPLQSGMGGRPTIVHGTTAHRGAAVTVNRGGDEWGWPESGCCCGLGRHGRIPKKDELGCQGELGRNEGLNRKACKIVFSFFEFDSNVLDSNQGY